MPLGSFRTWVKYTEAGEFPEVKRSFAVLRCNQCTDAPCVDDLPGEGAREAPRRHRRRRSRRLHRLQGVHAGLPVRRALHQRGQGHGREVPLLRAPRRGQGLAPACAVVCPTEAIIPGDFDDPDERRLAHAGASARSPRARPRPAPARTSSIARSRRPGIDPPRTSDAGGYLWAERRPGVAARRAASSTRSSEARRREARTTYDVAHPPLWGWQDLGATSSRSRSRRACSSAAIVGGSGRSTARRGSARLALGRRRRSRSSSSSLTAVLLVADLKRPERFLYILLRPNWRSWLVRGTYVADGLRRAARRAGPGAALLGSSTSGARAGARCRSRARSRRALGRLHGLALRPGEGARAVDAARARGCSSSCRRSRPARPCCSCSIPSSLRRATKCSDA